MFIGGKRKRHPALTVAVLGLAAFGAYSAVCCMKEKATSCMDGIKCMCSKLGKGKKSSCGCKDESNECCDGDK